MSKDPTTETQFPSNVGPRYLHVFTVGSTSPTIHTYIIYCAGCTPTLYRYITNQMKNEFGNWFFKNCPPLLFLRQVSYKRHWEMLREWKIRSFPAYFFTSSHSQYRYHSSIELIFLPIRTSYFFAQPRFYYPSTSLLHPDQNFASPTRSPTDFNKKVNGTTKASDGWIVPEKPTFVRIISFAFLSFSFPSSIQSSSLPHSVVIRKPSLVSD